MSDPVNRKVTGDQAPQNADTADDRQPAVAVMTPTPNLVGARMDPHTLLLRLRTSFPYLPVVPWPTSIKTKVLAAGGPAKNVDLDENTIGVLISATGPVYVSFDGAATVPAADNESQSVLISQPTPFMFYVFGRKQASVIAEQAATVQFMAFIDIANVKPRDDFSG